MKRRVFPVTPRDCSPAILRDCSLLILLTLVFLVLGVALGAMAPDEAPSTVSAIHVAQDAPSHPAWLLRANQVAADRVASIALAPVESRSGTARSASRDLHRLADRIGPHPQGAALARVIEELARALDGYATGKPGALAQLRASSAARASLMEGRE